MTSKGWRRAEKQAARALKRSEERIESGESWKGDRKPANNGASMNVKARPSQKSRGGRSRSKH
jgi:hypothetical protein